jgi:hypothetical protein
VPAEPLGLANILLALCDANVAVKLPVVVTGLFVTVNILGRVNPTLVTVPKPAPATATSKASIAVFKRLKLSSVCA